METRTYKVFKFSELSKEGQRRAIERYSDINLDGGFWENPDSVYDLKKELEKLGYNNFKLLYSGFNSQGDGACYEATIDIGKWLKSHKLLRKFPGIAKRSSEIRGSLEHRGRYFYSTMTSLEIEDENHDETLEHEIVSIELLILAERERYGNRLYQALKEEYNRQTSDEAIIDTFNANEYDFTAEGEID